MEQTILGILGMIWIVGILVTFIMLTLGLRYKKIRRNTFEYNLVQMIIFSVAWPIFLPMFLVLEVISWIDEKYNKFTRYPNK